jgi:MFS transporter, DHA3 family, tetracycline resistance protein
MATLFRSLTQRSFALLWSGQTISRLGNNLYRIAMAWWVLEKTGSATAMGTVMIFSSVPMLIFLLVGGVVTDRFPRLRVMWLSDLLSGLVVMIVAILAAARLLEVWHVYIASILFGLVSAFFNPAATAVIPEIAPAEMLPSANSLNSLSRQGTSIIGPAIGASIVAMGGTPLAFGLDALSFFISAACIIPILRTNPELNRAPLAPSSAQNGLRQGFHDLREGWQAVAASAWLWITIALFAFVNVTSGSPMSVSLPFLVKDNLHADVALLGLITSVSSVGYVVGAVWFGSYTRIRRRGPLAYIATLLIGVAVTIFGLTTSIPLLYAGAFLEGLAMSVFGLIWDNSLQTLVPRRLLGRVAAIDSLGSFVLLPIGYGIAGWATDLIGAPLVFLIGGIATIALALLGLLHPAIRGLD